MANVTISPNMNLPVPNVGQDPGPDWANNINASLSILDLHNHTAGFGVQIPPAGLNINTSLTFQNNQATNLQAVMFTPQTALTTLNSLYVVGVDLYFNDGSGDPAIQITKGGSVNATSSGIVSGTASAGFISGVLVVDSASLTPANIQAGSILFGNNVASSNFVTVQAPASLASDYSLTLPLVPAVTSFMQIDASGNMSAGPAISAGITGSNIAAATVTRANLTAPGQVQSSGTNYSTSSGSVVNTGNQVSLTTNGNPVLIIINGIFSATKTSGGGGQSGINIGYGINGSYYQTLSNPVWYDATGGGAYFSGGAAGSAIVPLAAGTYTFSIWIGSYSSAVTASMSSAYITVYEIK